MAGFFNKQQVQSITRPEGKHLSCYSCGLYKDAQTPKMKPYGNFKKEIMCIGECPGEKEDVLGKPWQGKSGMLLKKTLAQFDVDLFEDCICLNAVNCRPVTEEYKNRTPTQNEVNCCKRNVQSAIKQYKPKLIFLFGSLAVQSVIGVKWKKDLGKFSKWIGWQIPDQEYKAWLCPVFHPSYILREEKEEIDNLWQYHIEKALNVLNSEFPVYIKPNITFLENNELEQLHSVKEGSIISFDYETTGLKPHAKGHKILCCSIAVNEFDVFVFMINKKNISPFLNVLKNKNIKKVAHNLKYEQTWTQCCLKTDVENWYWDTMLQAHILDNRPDITGLKFQTYINFGIGDYSSEIEPVLQGEDSKNCNSLNKLELYMKSPENALKIMQYCALDSIFTYRLMLLQQKQIESLQLPF